MTVINNENAKTVFSAPVNFIGLASFDYPPPLTATYSTTRTDSSDMTGEGIFSYRRQSHPATTVKREGAVERYFALLLLLLFNFPLYRSSLLHIPLFCSRVSLNSKSDFPLLVCTDTSFSAYYTSLVPHPPITLSTRASGRPEGLCIQTFFLTFLPAVQMMYFICEVFFVDVQLRSRSHNQA